MLHNLFQFGFAGLAGICILGGFLRRVHRGSFFMAAASAASAAVAARYDVFWALAVFGLGTLWALFCATSYIDLSWRVKTGFVIFLGLGSALCIYPTYYDETHPEAKAELAELTSDQRSAQETSARAGELGFGRFVRSNIGFRLVQGLDLKGGLRLVYTVDVDEAIKDKRDRYYDELRTALTTALGFHSGDKAPTVEELGKLPTKVRIEKSREHVDIITLTFTDPADSKKIDDAFLARFLKELQLQRSADGSKITFRMRSEVESGIRESAVSQAKETVRRRIDSLGVKEPSLTVRDEDIILEMPGDDEKSFAEIREIISQTALLQFKMVDDDTDFFEAASKSKDEDLPKGLTFAIENAPVGKSADGNVKTKANHYARITKGEHEDLRDALKRLKEWVGTQQVDPDHEVGYAKQQEFDQEKEAFEDVGWRTYYLFNKAEITGDMVREAQAVADQSTGSLGGWHVQMTMTPLGGDRFEDITGRNVRRRFAIILDGKVESAPVIQNKIPGGVASITMGSGNPDQQLADSKKLELVLKSGALPAPISPSNEQRIGASLGKDAITQGGKGALAGIAVDANVLINERIREELRHGKSPRAAVDAGYDKAFSAIIDGHVTTMISGLILMQYGTGPIKGFAVTLFIGVLASLFTGVVCTRLMFDWAVRHRRVKDLHLG